MVPRDPPATDTWPKLLSRLPWWLGVLGAILAYVGLHSITEQGIPPEQLSQVDEGHAVRALAGLGQWLVPAALLAAAYGRWHSTLLRRELTADPVGTTLRELSLNDFEALVAQLFRHRGYQVSEGAAGYAGGRREIVLTREDGRAIDPLPQGHSRGTPPASAVVHIRYWQAWRVGATEVRELIAAVAANGAERGFLVVPGEFTRDARRLAEGNPIETIDGADLRALVQAGRGGPPAPVSASGIRPLGGLPHPLRSTRFDFSRVRGLPLFRRSAATRPGARRRLQIPIRYALRLVGVLLAAAVILGGFDWITSLPDKRLAPAKPPEPAAAPASQAASSRVAEPPAPAAPTKPLPAPSPPPGLGDFRSVHELDAAFEAFYVPPPGCADPASHADMVGCANHRIRARRGYMAAGTPTEPAMGPEAQEGQDGDLAWEEEAAINALVPPHADQPGPDAAQWHSDGDPSLPREAPPLPRKHEEKDPEATYAPYDPKAPWTEP